VKKVVEIGDLHPLVLAVRKRLVKEVDERAFRYRFGDKARESIYNTASPHLKCSYGFDMAMMMHPAHADLAYVEAMVTALHGRPCPGRRKACRLDTRVRSFTLGLFLG
jgi:hypothetical protein